MSMNIKGSVRRILDTRKVSEKFSVREFDIETTGDKYPQTLRLQATNDRISQVDGLNIGDEVSIDVNLRGREWKGNDGVVKVFNSIDAWRIEKTGATASAGTSPARDAQPAGNDDLPF